MIFCFMIPEGQLQGLYKTCPSSQSHEVIETSFESRSGLSDPKAIYLHCHSLFNIKQKGKQSRFCGFLFISGLVLHLIYCAFIRNNFTESFKTPLRCSEGGWGDPSKWECLGQNISQKRKKKELYIPN